MRFFTETRFHEKAWYVKKFVLRFTSTPNYSPPLKPKRSKRRFKRWNGASRSFEISYFACYISILPLNLVAMGVEARRRECQLKRLEYNNGIDPVSKGVFASVYTKGRILCAKLNERCHCAPRFHLNDINRVTRETGGGREEKRNET